MTTELTDIHGLLTAEVPLALSSSEGLGLAPQKAERWRLAVDVARGRMAGGWVPVDADVVLAIAAAMQRNQEGA
jgi:hypothetical protein